MHRETLRETAEFRLQRCGRFLITELLQPHRVLSTSARSGGQSESVRYLVNHQSCEANDHRERHLHITQLGMEAYHDFVCGELGLPPHEVALMGTAANMNYAGIVQHRTEDVAVTAVVTAGVHGNAACAGDPTTWQETEHGWQKVPAHAGTINTLLLISRPLTEGALARAVVTMTEAKSAALQRLAIRSRYSREFATGTSTDQYCIAAPLSAGWAFQSTSTGVKLGELLGLAVRDAMLEALRWQNGLEASYTRSIFHALERFGLKESSFSEDIRPYLSEREWELLKGNHKAIVYEPLVSAAAYAIASVLDRLRHGTLPEGVAREALRQQAATLAASLAARPQDWSDFYRSLNDVVDIERPERAVLASIALGWSAKWR
jgi:adenosylcobinamide amidohydrolase